MKKNVFLLCVMMVAMMAASVGLTSCSKDDDGGVAGAMTGNIVGTWNCEYYCIDGSSGNQYPMGDDYDLPFTTVTLRADGTCEGSGVIINGKGNYTVVTANGWEDGYWAIFTFTQNGKTVCTATLESYNNDRMTGYVTASGHGDKWFVFKKQ
jgi:hypothetical protein